MAPITVPIAVTILGKTARAIGTYLTATAPIPEGVDHVGLTDLMTDAVASNTAKSFLLTAFVSPDGIAWRSVFQEAWQGGTHLDKATGLSVPNHVDTQWANSDLQSGLWAGWQVRAELVLPVSLTIGLIATVYPATP